MNCHFTLPIAILYCQLTYCIANYPFSLTFILLPCLHYQFSFYIAIVILHCSIIIFYVILSVICHFTFPVVVYTVNDHVTLPWLLIVLLNDNFFA